MTLVEVIVSLAILTMLSVFIISVLITCLNIIKSNAELKKDSRDAAAGIENTIAGFGPDSDISVTNETDGTFSITFNGVTIDVSGSYVDGSDTDGNTKYHCFIPG